MVTGINSMTSDTAARTAAGTQGTDKEQRAKETDKAQVQADGKGNMTIQANTLNFADDKIEEKRKKAKEMALDLLQNVFSDDQKVEADIQERNRHAEELAQENVEHNEVLANISKEQDNLKELHGINPYGQEEADCQLLLKEQEAGRNPAVKLTDEEKKQLEQLHENGLTQYQKDMLLLDNNKYEYEQKIEENQQQIRDEYANVRGIRKEQLKHHNMVDAQKQGEKILTAANKEIIGMIIDDARNQIDEQYEEIEQKAEEKKEEEEQLEEKIEAAKGEKREEEDDMEEMYELNDVITTLNHNISSNNTGADMKKSINQIINELKLTDEDIKGVKVDEKK